jgi:hypothetical protein
MLLPVSVVRRALVSVMVVPSAAVRPVVEQSGCRHAGRGHRGDGRVAIWQTVLCAKWISGLW